MSSTWCEVLSRGSLAAGVDGARGRLDHRDVVIAGWKRLQKGTLVGFFSATLPSGMVLHNLMLHERNGARWIGFPGREWTNQAGQQQFAKLIEFRDRATADKFRDAVLDALDKHLEQLP
jgi:hypothetical protein